VTQGNVGDPNNVKANDETTGGAMQEAWAYYAGKTGLSTRDYADIKPATGCQRNFVVFIANSIENNNSPNDSSQDVLTSVPYYGLQNAPGITSDLLAPIKNISQPTSSICKPTSNDANALANHTATSGLYADDWARYMRVTDLYGNLDGTQNISTYAIGILGPDCNSLFPTLLNSMATQGGGAYYSAYTNQDLFDSLTRIFNEVQAINSVFASASLPVSVNTQGTYLNQVYIGMFRPDGDDKPRWVGNLKQYKFGVDNSNPSFPQLFLADSTGARAIASAGTGTGFLSPNAISYWTKKDTSALPDNLGTNGGFWINNQQPIVLGFDSPDGQWVERGAVSQQIRLANLIDDYAKTAGSASPNGNPRNLFTCTSGSGVCGSGASLSSTPFAPANSDISDALLGTTSGGAIAITSFSRSGTNMTVTLQSVPSPPLTVGQSVNIVGASLTSLNGAQAVTAVLNDTFTFKTVESPPTPSTGTYRASKTVSNPKTITSLSRSGTTATAVVTNHGYIDGQIINISNADPTTSGGYNGSYVITVVNADTFTYTIPNSNFGPPSGTASGTALVVGQNVSTQAILTSIVHPLATGTTTNVTFSIANGSKLDSSFVAGAQVTVSGAPTGYNGTFTISNIGNGCPSGSPNRSFCITGLPVTPATTATAASGQTLSADTAISYAVTFTHTASTCPAANGELVTVTGAAAGHNFAVNDTVIVSGTPGINETAYIGSFKVLSVVANTSFTFSLATTPSCSPSATGASLLINPNAVDRTALINWMRGEDSIGDELTPRTIGINVRGSIHGDVLHSRPALVNYGTGKIVAFYGGGDGVFHAVNANQTVDISSVPPGGELWGFIPTDFFSKLSRLYLNSPLVKLFTTPNSLTPAPQQKPYFFDGDVGVYQQGTNPGDKTYIYLSARRGGRLIYALDVSDPADPKFLWKRGCSGTTCDAMGSDSGTLAELGQTWSEPKVVRIKGLSNPVVVFGAGYDSNEDNDPPTADTMGRGVFMLDAVDGHIVWQAGPGGGTDSCKGTPCTLSSMTYAIPASVTLVDRNFDNFAERMYVADTGGNIWRIDLPTASPADWTVTKFAALGGTVASGETKRKFLYSPDIVYSLGFDMILGATGDREHPLKLNTSAFKVINRFYGLKDPNNGIGSNPSVPPTTWTPITDSTSSTANQTVTGLFNCDACSSSGTVYDNSGSGFYVTFPASGTATGEKGVNAASSIGGYTYFSTNEPKGDSTTSCVSNLGTARGYKIGTFSGAVKVGKFEGGGLPPSPVFGLVTVPFPNPDGTTTDRTVPFLIGGGDSGGGGSGGSTGDLVSPIGGQIPTILINPKRSRKYWYQEHDK
jgi:type IV pilus assembly protein PilY1